MVFFTHYSGIWNHGISWISWDRSSRLPSPSEIVFNLTFLKFIISNHITTGQFVFQITSFIKNVCHFTTLSNIVSILYHLRIYWVITPHLLHLHFPFILVWDGTGVCLNLLWSLCKWSSDCHLCQTFLLVTKITIPYYATIMWSDQDDSHCTKVWNYLGTQQKWLHAIVVDDLPGASPIPCRCWNQGGHG